MTLRDMHYICTIANERSITKAAAKLFVAQPALSQCVQKVEKELGIVLFIRTPTGVLSTQEGTCFLQFAQKTLLEERGFKKQLSDLSAGEGGGISIGFTGTQATYVLPDILPRFHALYPQIQINLVEATSNEIEEKIVLGEVDLGIIHPPVLSPQLDYFEISRDHMVIVPRSSSRFQSYIYYKEDQPVPYLNIEFLKQEPILVTRPWQRSRMIVDQIFTNAGMVPIIRQVTKSISTLDALAQVDYATAILPEKQLSSATRCRPYFRIDEDYDVIYSFLAATLSGGYLSRPAGKLVAFLRENSHLF